MCITHVRVQVPPRAPKRKTGKSLSFFGLWGCEESAFIGAPARIQRSGSRGERSHSGATELSPPGGSEGCTACGDAVPPRAQKKRDIRWTALFFSSWGVKNPPLSGPPCEPSAAVLVGKGAAAERPSFRCQAEARNAQLAATPSRFFAKNQGDTRTAFDIGFFPGYNKKR